MRIEEALRQAPFPVRRWQIISGKVIHVFTHFRLDLTIVAGTAEDSSTTPDALWIKPRDFASHALPTVMKKVVRHRLAVNAG